MTDTVFQIIVLVFFVFVTIGGCSRQSIGNKNKKNIKEVTARIDSLFEVMDKQNELIYELVTENRDSLSVYFDNKIKKALFIEKLADEKRMTSDEVKELYESIK